MVRRTSSAAPRSSAQTEDTFGQRDTYVLMVPKESTATQTALSNALHEIPQVKSILSYVDTVGETIPEECLDSGTLSKLNSAHYTRMVLTVDAVQFVIKTAAIEQAETAETDAAPEAPLTFAQKLLRLFGLY